MQPKLHNAAESSANSEPLGASVWKGSATTPKLGIEKRVLKDGSEVMKKELNKWLDKAAALEAKEDQGSDKPTGSKKQTTVQQLREWLRKTWNKILPFGDGQDGENKDDCEPTVEKDGNDSSRREAPAV